jgi:hypothetical protein
MGCFKSAAHAKKNIDLIANFAGSQGMSFSPAQGDGSSIERQRRVSKTVNYAIEQAFDHELPAFQKLPAFANAFNKIEGNGYAQCSLDEHGSFVDFFLIFDASITIAMHASMRVVSIDGAHLPHNRSDLRLLALEGMPPILHLRVHVCNSPCHVPSLHRRYH